MLADLQQPLILQARQATKDMGNFIKMVEKTMLSNTNRTGPAV